MPSQFPVAVILGIMVVGGLAFRDRIATRLAALDRDNDLLDSEELD